VFHQPLRQTEALPRPIADAVATRHPAAAVVIPPRVTTVPNEAAVTQRDRHPAEITTHGRMDEAARGSARVSAWNGSERWQRRSGYNRRSLVETGMYRYKAIVGRRLNAWTLPNQRTEAKIGCTVINRMTGLGMPATVRVR
jgi:hypothetical protein